MAVELSYVILNPHTLAKSRTGGVLARLLTRTALDLVAAQMFVPSQALLDEYVQNIVTENDPQDRSIQELIRAYVQEQYAPDPATGQRRRVMMLLFRGEDAVRRTREVVGHIKNKVSGETIRETYGDYVLNRDGSVRYFEPAVLAAPTREEAVTKLAIWAKYADTDGELEAVSRAVPTHGQPGHERTLVIIKPDNFKFPSGRPGNVIDVFSRAGLAITAMKVHRMTVNEAEAFYGPVRPVLREHLSDSTAAKARELIESALDLRIDAKAEKLLSETLGPLAAEKQFNNIVRFMSGRSAAETDPDERDEPGSEKMILLVYEGIDAVRKIREVLGPTDPAKAPPGSIRREFGQTIMVNAAHASDSAANAARELGIVKITENPFKTFVGNFPN
jgi:nucleoside diphosphate kinase